MALNKRPSVVDLVPLSLYEDEGSSFSSSFSHPQPRTPAAWQQSSPSPRPLFERLLSSTGASAPWSAMLGSSSALLSGAVRCGGSSLPEGHQSLFFSWTDTTPEDMDVTDGRPHSFGVRFKVRRAGHVTAVRFIKAAGEGGQGHYAHVFEWESRQLLASTEAMDDSACRGPTWVTVELPTPLPVWPGREYLAAVDGVRHFARTTESLAGGRKSGDLVVVRGGGVFGRAGAMPRTTKLGHTNFWVDVDFVVVPEMELGEGRARSGDVPVKQERAPNHAWAGDTAQEGPAASEALAPDASKQPSADTPLAGEEQQQPPQDPASEAAPGMLQAPAEESADDAAILAPPALLAPPPESAGALVINEAESGAGSEQEGATNGGQHDAQVQAEPAPEVPEAVQPPQDMMPGAAQGSEALPVPGQEAAAESPPPPPESGSTAADNVPLSSAALPLPVVSTEEQQPAPPRQEAAPAPDVEAAPPPPETSGEEAGFGPEGPPGEAPASVAGASMTIGHTSSCCSTRTADPRLSSVAPA